MFLIYFCENISKPQLPWNSKVFVFISANCCRDLMSQALAKAKLLVISISNCAVTRTEGDGSDPYNIGEAFLHKWCTSHNNNNILLC